jgi:LmbE family N-acetylglucosaminyl deacetylase
MSTAAESHSSLQPVPEDWQRALAVVAHPDDLEYGSASAVARWTAQGKQVVYALVSSGEAGIDSLPPERCGPLREDEQRRSAAVVGVDTVEFLGHPDGLIEPSLDLRRDLAGLIRRHRPEVLISIHFGERWPGGAVNHVDHRTVGLALIDAARDAANRWLFPGVGGAPWNGVRFAVFGGSPSATHGVDVTETLDAGVRSLAEHRTYLEALAPGTTGTDPDAFLRGMAEATGPALGVAAAVGFELVPLG